RRHRPRLEPLPSHRADHAGVASRSCHARSPLRPVRDSQAFSRSGGNPRGRTAVFSPSSCPSASLSARRPSSALLHHACSMRRTLSRPWFVRAVVIGGLLLALVTGGCAALQHEERRLTFRALRDAASWYSGLSDVGQVVTLAVPGADG